MKAAPKPGEWYRQEYYRGEAEDMAAVAQLSQTVSVPYGNFENCLQTKEWTPLEPDVVEDKYYAPNHGLVLEIVVEGGVGRIELVEVATE